MKKHLIAASALGLVLAAPVYAQDAIDVTDNNIAAGSSAAFDDGNSVAADGSLAIADSGNDNDLSTDESVNDSFNAAVSDSLNTTVRDSGNITDSGNLALDVNAVVSVASLGGTVSGNTVANALAGGLGVNTISGGAFSELSGINQNVQGVGPNSLAQQNVSVQANMTLGGE